METLILHPNPNSPAWSPPPPAVYVEGQRRTDLCVESWTLQSGPDFGRAEILAAMSDPLRPDLRLQDVSLLPTIGSRLQIRLGEPAAPCVFDGLVSAHVARWDQDQEQLLLVAQDYLHVRLNTPLMGRWQGSGQAGVFVADAPNVFNDPHGPLASATTFSVGRRACRIFQDGSDARPWRLAEILDYLLCCFVPADIAIPSLDELEVFAGNIVPPRLALTSLSLRDALAKACAAGALTFRGGMDAQTNQRSLVFFRPGQDGPLRTLQLQPAGEVYDSRRTNLWKGHVTIRRRPGRRGILILGSPKRYEVTLELQKGWDPALATAQYRPFIRGESADWPHQADVYRKWVLNEASQYSTPPWNLPPGNLSSISTEDFVLTVARRLEPCLSADSARFSQGVVVELSTDAGLSWKRYPGPVRLAADECSLWLEDDALPADYFQAVTAGTIRLRVTATLASDRHLAARQEGDPSCRLHVIQYPHAAWARVHSSSIFYDPQHPSPFQRDDTAPLTQLAATLSRSSGNTVEADLHLSTLDSSVQVGDRIEQIQGRQLDLGCFEGLCPFVRKVEHHCGQDWTTHLIVSG